MLDKLISVILSFFIGIWLARYLGPVNFGTYNYAIALVGLFSTFSSFGIDSIVVREFVKNQFKEDQIFNNAFIIKILGSFLILLFIGFGIFFTKNTTEVKLLVLCISISCLLKSSDVIDLLFQSKVLIKYPTIARTISFFTSSFLKITFILLGLNVVFFGLIFIIEALVLLSGYFYFLSMKSKIKFSFEYSKSTISFLLKQSFPLLLSGIFVTSYMRIDQLMIKEFLGVYEVGIYSTAVKISESINFIPTVIVSSLFPIIVSSKLNQRLYFKRLKLLFLLLIFIALSISLFITLFSHYIIFYLLGEQYIESVEFINTLIWASIAISIGVLSNSILINENLQKRIFISSFIGAVINIFLNIILIKRFGISGAVYSSIFSYSISGFLIYLIFSDSRKIIMSVIKN